MCSLPAAAIGMSVASTAMQMKGARDQAGANSQTALNNAANAERAAQDAEYRGELDAQRVQRSTRSLVGNQRASFAARGIDQTDGTAADIVEQTNFFGKTDAATARYNGRAEAYSKRTQAANFMGEADAARTNGNNAVAGSLLSGATAVASHWYPKPTPAPEKRSMFS